jgi:16S rRNA (guanine527-N7)-methyltransferase
MGLSDLIEGGRLVGADVDAPSLERLDRFVDLLVVWNRRFHLTGDRDRDVLIRKHVVDSLAVVPELPSSGVVIDLGSGAGFPGIVLACSRPDLALRLIESRRRPASFLSEAIRTIPLPTATALAVRGEDLASDPAVMGRAALVVSRALRLDVVTRLAAPLLAPAGELISMQTPGTDEATARATGRPVGLDLLRVRDYRLPEGESRRLLIFGRAVPKPTSD